MSDHSGRRRAEARHRHTVAVPIHEYPNPSNSKDGYEWQMGLFSTWRKGLLLLVILGSTFLGFQMQRQGAATQRTSVDIIEELNRWNAQSDDEVLQTMVDDVRRFISSKGAAGPTFGISRGHYSRASPQSLFKLKNSCFQASNSADPNVLPFNTTNPPPALLLPGLLSARPHLSEISQCFLFYSEKLWTRATGGMKGAPLSRLGGIDDKELFVDSITKYKQTNNCGQYAAASDGTTAGGASEDGLGGLVQLGGGVPPSVLLRDEKTCERFFRSNHLWAASNDTLWSVKKGEKKAWKR